MKRVLYAIIVCAVFLPLIARTQYAAQGVSANGIGHKENRINIPPAWLMKTIGEGFLPFTADLWWLRTIQYTVTPQNKSDLDTIARLIDLVTDIDPHFLKPYYFGSAVFMWEPKGSARALEIVKKGLKNNPDDWMLYFHGGFISFFFMLDTSRAAYYLGGAASQKNCPPSVKMLAAKYAIEADDTGHALAIIDEMLKNTSDEKVRKNLFQRRNQALSVDIAGKLTAAVMEYERRTGTPPADLDTLVRDRVISQIPSDPLGGRFVLDRFSKKVSSTGY